MVGQPLTRRSLLGLLAAGGFAAAGLGGFLYAEGRIGPARVNARAFVDLLESLGGRFAGYRRAHGKGMAVTGRFESSGAGAEVSSASVFAKGEHRLDGRFSLGGPNAHQPDALGAARGLGLRFFLPEGEQWRTAMINSPVFPAQTPEAFFAFNVANRPDPATGKPDPAKLAEFLAANPATAAALAIAQAAKPSPTFASSTFYGLSAFVCTHGSGTKTPVRFSLVPDGAEAAEAVGDGPDFLFEDLAERLRRGPVRYKLMLQIGEPGEDPTNDPTKPWPESRRRIEAGTVVLEPAAKAAAARIRDTNFDPTVLPEGIELSDDPIPPARAAIYAESFRRRSLERPPAAQQFGEEG
ncbi:catalase family peroxidase [Segniliparus rugosus]|uniref:Catalase-related peroxidase n=1 Tax=Segniliparus rugosus (strain ATCC BAA-974 / DSM 45345 / CCUG 50838 / CIP 108380 / JCM 13579 / CDC 945) TaxID=679197 RepID=E5XTM4_SEGRC|nr:catalase family peroxidase [Segniliparus rugosus]EFV12286.1 hypothetical protein HMPREF9336_02846 [Segniliparus rugosus ATCC BAA-974]